MMIRNRRDAGFPASLVCGAVSALLALSAACSSSGTSTGTVSSAGAGGTTAGVAGTSGASGQSASGSGAGGSPGAGGGNIAGTGGGGGAGVSGAGAAGSSGAPSAGAPGTGCASGRYLLCEDFESTALGATPNGWTKHGDASGVADDAAKHGTHSLKLGAIPVWERRIYHDASALGGAHWGRIFYKVQLPVPDAFVHSTLVAFGGTGPTIGAAEYRVVDTVKQAIDTPDVASRIQFLYNVQPQTGNEFGTGTSYDRTFDDQWHCAEWHIDSANQSYQFYFDGTQQITFEKGAGNYAGAEIPASFDQIKIGWINYQTSPPGFTAWLDDLAVATDRVGCD